MNQLCFASQPSIMKWMLSGMEIIEKGNIIEPLTRSEPLFYNILYKGTFCFLNESTLNYFVVLFEMFMFSSSFLGNNNHSIIIILIKCQYDIYSFCHIYRVSIFNAITKYQYQSKFVRTFCNG